MSDFARRVQVEHLGGDAVIIPNGVHVAAFAEGPSLPGHTRGVDGPTIGFLGRYDEPRKGLPVLLEAMRTVVRRHPGAQLLIAGRGDPAEARELIGDGPAGPRRAARRADGGGQGRVPAVGRHLLRAQPAGGVLRRRPHRGPRRGGAHRRQRPRRVRPGARARGRPGCSSAAGTPARWPARWGTCWRIRPAAPSSPPAERPWPPNTTGGCWPGASWPSTRRSSCPVVARYRRRGRRLPRCAADGCGRLDVLPPAGPALA